MLSHRLITSAGFEHIVIESSSMSEVPFETNGTPLSKANRIDILAPSYLKQCPSRGLPYM